MVGCNVTTIHLQQHGFLLKIVRTITYSITLENKSIALIGYKSAPVTIAPNSSADISPTLWVGPEIQSEMSAIAHI